MSHLSERIVNFLRKTSQSFDIEWDEDSKGADWIKNEIGGFDEVYMRSSSCHIYTSFFFRENMVDGTLDYGKVCQCNTVQFLFRHDR